MPKILYFLFLLPKPYQRRFQQFLESPYFNSRKDLPLLLKALIPYANLVESGWDKWEENAYSTWKKGKKFKQNEFRKSCSALVELYYTFIGIEFYQTRSGLPQMHQLHALNQLGEEKYFGKFYKKVFQQQVQKSEEIEEEDFWISSLVLNSAITHEHLLPERKEVSHFFRAGQQLDHYYVLRKFKYALAMMGQNQMLGAEIPDSLTHFFDYFEKIFDKGQSWHPIIHAYRHLLFAYQFHEEEVHYLNLKNLLEHELHELSKNELRELFTATLNLCTKQRRREPKFYDPEYGNLYQIMIDRDLLWVEGKILAWHVKNISIYHGKRGNFQWLASFIDICRDKLIPSQKKQVLLFCEGLLAFYQKEHITARKKFNSLLNKFDDVFYGLDARVLLACALYELGDSALEQLLGSAPRFIKSKKISEGQKLPRLNFFRFLRILYKTPRYKQEKIGELEQMVLKESPIASKEWLLEQIEKQKN